MTKESETVVGTETSSSASTISNNNNNDIGVDDDDEAVQRAQLTDYIAELREKILTKCMLRNANIGCVRPPDTHFSRLDSSLKKNTAFVKRLKLFMASQLDAVLKDMATLNLTKYISEICSALVEAKLKLTDVGAAVQLASRLHLIYTDFAQTFFENWQKVLAIKPSERIANPSKLRVDLRFFAELISAGIFSNKIGLPLLGSVLINLISQDKDDYSNLSIILSFCRHCGEEYAGLVPATIIRLERRFTDIGPLPVSTLLTRDKQHNLKNLLRDYYGSLCKYLRGESKAMQAAHRSIRNAMESKGEVSIERKEKLDVMQANYDKLFASVLAMADLLNEPMPELPKDEEAGKSGIVLDMLTDDSADSQLDPWGDEETKSFYVDLPDLRIFLPNFAPKLLPIQPDEPTMTEEALDLDIEPDQLIVDDEQAVAAEIGDVEEQSTSLVGVTAASTTAIANKTDSTSINPATATTTTPMSMHSTKQQLDIFLHNLANCVNKELIDSAAIEFLLTHNTKSNRKRLTNTLFGVQRTRLDLLPFYARFVATINLVAIDVAAELAQKLKNEFKYHIAKKNQMNIESKIKVVRFIGEMVKFGLYSKIEALFCLKVLLLDFQHHQIEMTCAFLEVAGQYLYNSRDSRLRTNVYLEQMMRLKTATALDSRHAAQVENSYYHVKPPEGINAVHKIRPPMHAYIRHLLFEELSKSNVDRIIKLMRRLPWDDKEVNAYAVKCLAKAYHIRYHLIRCLADLVSGISSYQDKTVVRIIDTVFEDIRAGLETNSPKLAQRRIAMAKYLGELYNYRLVESANILNTLYSIISLGVNMDDGAGDTPMDPPESLFRLKLACVLLDTCGQYFTSAVSKKRLDYFLVFFQQYYWYKKSHPMYSDDGEMASSLFPILVDHMYMETMLTVRPKIKLYKSYEQAKAEVEKLRQQLYPNLNTSSILLDGSGDATIVGPVELGTINEDVELTDDQTQNDLTAGDEDETSEAIADSEEEDDDDEDEDGGGVRGSNRRQDKDDDDDRISPFDSNASPEHAAAAAASVAVVAAERQQEDIDFELAFEKMAADSYQERIRDTVKGGVKDIAVPIMAKMNNSKKTYDQISNSTATPTTHVEDNSVVGGIEKGERNADSVPFVLMMRGTKGKGQQFRTFAAPVDSALARNLRAHEEQIREENEKVKRLTLNITERLEEEDYQISLLQSQRAPAEQHRQQHKHAHKQPKYKHQKGAPDADLIFG